MAARARDVLSGVAVAGLLLPEGVAYAGIAGLPPGRALAAGIAGGLAYAALGRSRFAVLSPTSSSAAILAAALVGIGSGVATNAAARDADATALVLIVAAIFGAASALRLGSLAGFVSRPVLRGFAFGLALTIIVKQLPRLAGVAAGGSTVWAVIAGLARQASAFHWPSLALGAGALAALLALRRVPQVPGALAVIAAGIALSLGVDLPARGVALAGPVTLAWPALALPTGLAHWGRLVQLAAPIALILFAESWGTIRALALRHGDGAEANRELMAIGGANLAAALVQGMPVGAGFSAGSANEAAGATTRLAALSAALALLALGLFAGPLIERIPEPVLAAVVVAALTHALAPGPIVRLFGIRSDGLVAVVAALGVLAFGVLDGMLAAIALSLAQLLYRFSHPSISELGRLADGHDFVDRLRHPEAAAIPGLAIYRPNAPLFFANAEAVLAAIAARAAAARARTVVVSLEETAVLDSTAAEALGELDAQLKAAKITLLLARAHDQVRDVLARIGDNDLATRSTYSVADAAARFARGDG